MYGQKDDRKPPKVVCATAGRFISNKSWSTESWEKNVAWKEYMTRLEESVKRTHNKSVDAVEPTAGETSVTEATPEALES